jgi:aconitate hydratase
MNSIDSFKTKKILHAGGKDITIFSISALRNSIDVELTYLPFSLRLLLENLLRREDGRVVRKEDIERLVKWDPAAKPSTEIAFMPARVLLQDFTGVPCMVDLAVMRDAMITLGGDPNKINPIQPVDLVIDHSVQVDEYGTAAALRNNTAFEFERNRERYAFLRWGQQAFKNFRVVPPDTGIVHQINLEYLAQVVFTSQNGDETLAYPDTVVGTDSHTTMINGLGVLGWGVGGIEAEAAMLGQPISMLIPQVVGFKMRGKLKPGATATDLVLTVTQLLRKKGVVGKFVEFFGPGLSSLSIADRATIANMAPEYGATMGFFPVDAETINFLRFTGRSEEHIALTEAYLKEQGFIRTAETPDPVFSDIIDLDLSSVEPSIAGPKRPQDRIALSKAKTSFRSSLLELFESKDATIDKMAAANWAYYSDDSVKFNFLKNVPVKIGESQFNLQHGSVVIAAITSCTNTSNPSVLIAAGLLAKKACEKGLTSKPWVKTSLAPGSKVVTKYLQDASLMQPLESLGFHVVGYGCTTCIGNSGPLPEPILKAIQENDLITAAVLSGNRNFEGRVNPNTRSNYLASPPLVVAYALAGTMDIDFVKNPIGTGKNNEPVYLKDIWPTPQEIEQTMQQSVKSEMFKQEYANVFEGEAEWKNLPVPAGVQYPWEAKSTYIKAAPYFENFPREPKPLQNIHNARVLALLGDSVTTDHISPAGSFSEESPAGAFLTSLGVQKKDFNQYGARRGNHDIMMRGTFANIRIKNLLVPGIEGGITLHPSFKEPISIFNAAMIYKGEGTLLIIIAGKEYGSGSSRDWAAKGPALLGVRAVIAESFERIHRSNLIGMGILPLQFEEGQNYQSIGLSGFEVFDIEGIAEELQPRKKLTVTALSKDGSKKNFSVLCRIDTPNEVDYYKHDGILHYVLRSLLKQDQQDDELQTQSAVDTNAQKYQVLFKGEIEKGQNLETVKDRLTRLFKTSPERIEKLFTGKPITLNHHIDYTKAREYSNELKNAGAICIIEPMPNAPSVPSNKNLAGAPSQSVSKVAAAPKSKPLPSKNGDSAKPVEPTPQISKPPLVNSKNGTVTKIAQPTSIHSKSILAGGIASAVGMILLPLLYIVLILFIFDTLYGHIEDNVTFFSDYPLALGLLFYIVPIFIGVLLIGAMVKPLIARPSVKNPSIPLSRKKEPALYAFIEKLCRAIGSKIPAKIEVDCSLRVSANYRRLLTSFIEDDLTLTIGLPIISEMTIPEFANLLASQLGQYTDTIEMRISYVITTVNQWFTQVVYGRDVLDDKLAAQSFIASGFLSQVPLNIAKLFIWLSRKILMMFLLAGHSISRAFVRRLQFEADACSVQLAGFESFKSSLMKLDTLAGATDEAFAQLKSQRNPNDNSLPDDFILLISSVIQQMSNKDNLKTKKLPPQEKAAQHTVDPSHQERIEQVNTIVSKDMFLSDKLASTLFVNFEELNKNASIRLYRETLGLQFEKDDLVPTNQFDTSPNPTQGTVDIDTSFF